MDLLGYGAFFLTTALIFSLVTLGLNLQWGLTGLFNVGLPASSPSAPIHPRC